MTKCEFLAQLRKGLSGSPKGAVEEQLSFYSEMIDDRMEEGMPETEAVAAVGSPERIAAQILENTPLKKSGKRRLKAWEIVLLALGSPVWLSLGIAAIAVVFSLLISLWAVFGALVACAFAAVAAGVIFACNGNAFPGIAMVAGAMVCAGLSIFLLCGCKAVTKGILTLTKNCFVKKEVAQ